MDSLWRPFDHDRVGTNCTLVSSLPESGYRRLPPEVYRSLTCFSKHIPSRAPCTCRIGSGGRITVSTPDASKALAQSGALRLFTSKPPSASRSRHDDVLILPPQRSAAAGSAMRATLRPGHDLLTGHPMFMSSVETPSSSMRAEGPLLWRCGEDCAIVAFRLGPRRYGS